ncbi:MAG: leucyl/phenylalanyl-tRNA--protein transferase [Chloroflexi bacterium]|nr:leucyl/phenylalanyl-tRNA--protein transferase [Chloroflexota bacterium]
MNLSPTLLVIAYSQGLFPMSNRAGGVDWFDPDPRAILPLDDSFRISRSLARTLRRNPFEIKVDTAFREVMSACAQPAPSREATWISDEFVEAYSQLNRAGLAHSVEAWLGGELVGGLYGVSLGGLFAGESMFSRVRDASKVALVHLTWRLRAGGFVLHDTQFATPHLQTFGVTLIPREEYKARLAEALKVRATF